MRGTLTSNVQHIAGTRAASAAAKTDSSVVAWCYAAYSGDSTAVREALAGDVQHIAANSTAVHGALAIDVQHIADTGAAFVDVKTDGSVAAWGYAA